MNVVLSMFSSCATITTVYGTTQKQAPWFIETRANRNGNTVCAVPSSFKVNIWSELLYSPTQPEPSETSFLSFL